MAVIPIRVKRNGIEKTGEIGYTADGKSRLSTTTVEPQEPFNQPVKEGLVKMLIEFEEKDLSNPTLDSEVKNITTWWGKGFVSPNGKIVSPVISKHMLTNEVDKAAFVSMFANAILRFALNGRVRALEGHNDLPVFNAQGALITTYTPEQESAEPTGGYYPALTPPAPTPAP